MKVSSLDERFYDTFSIYVHIRMSALDSARSIRAKKAKAAIVHDRTKSSILGCGQDQFQCRTGDCIRNDQRCDGRIDCEDGSDEPSECGNYIRDDGVMINLRFIGDSSPINKFPLLSSPR